MRYFKPLDGGKVEITHCNQTDIRGWIPASLANSQNISVSMEELCHLIDASQNPTQTSKRPSKAKPNNNATPDQKDEKLKPEKSDSSEDGVTGIPKEEKKVNRPEKSDSSESNATPKEKKEKLKNHEKSEKSDSSTEKGEPKS